MNGEKYKYENVIVSVHLSFIEVTASFIFATLTLAKRF